MTTPQCLTPQPLPSPSPSTVTSPQKLSNDIPTKDYLTRKLKKSELQEHCRSLGLTGVHNTKDILAEKIIKTMETQNTGEYLPTPTKPVQNHDMATSEHTQLVEDGDQTPFTPQSYKCSKFTQTTSPWLETAEDSCPVVTIEVMKQMLEKVQQNITSQLESMLSTQLEKYFSATHTQPPHTHVTPNTYHPPTPAAPPATPLPPSGLSRSTPPPECPAPIGVPPAAATTSTTTAASPPIVADPPITTATNTDAKTPQAPNSPPATTAATKRDTRMPGHHRAASAFPGRPLTTCSSTTTTTTTTATYERNSSTPTATHNNLPGPPTLGRHFNRRSSDTLILGDTNLTNILTSDLANNCKIRTIPQANFNILGRWVQESLDWEPSTCVIYAGLFDLLYNKDGADPLTDLATLVYELKNKNEFMDIYVCQLAPSLQSDTLLTRISDLNDEIIRWSSLNGISTINTAPHFKLGDGKIDESCFYSHGMHQGSLFNRTGASRLLKAISEHSDKLKHYIRWDLVLNTLDPLLARPPPPVPPGRAMSSDGWTTTRSRGISHPFQPTYRPTSPSRAFTSDRPGTAMGRRYQWHAQPPHQPPHQDYIEQHSPSYQSRQEARRHQWHVNLPYQPSPPHQNYIGTHQRRNQSNFHYQVYKPYR